MDQTEDRHGNPQAWNRASTGGQPSLRPLNTNGLKPLTPLNAAQPTPSRPMDAQPEPVWQPAQPLTAQPAQAGQGMQQPPAQPQTAQAFQGTPPQSLQPRPAWQPAQTHAAQPVSQQHAPAWQPAQPIPPMQPPAPRPAWQPDGPFAATPQAMPPQSAPAQPHAALQPATAQPVRRVLTQTISQQSPQARQSTALPTQPQSLNANPIAAYVPHTGTPYTGMPYAQPYPTADGQPGAYPPADAPETGRRRRVTAHRDYDPAAQTEAQSAYAYPTPAYTHGRENAPLPTRAPSDQPTHGEAPVPQSLTTPAQTGATAPAPGQSMVTSARVNPATLRGLTSFPAHGKAANAAYPPANTPRLAAQAAPAARSQAYTPGVNLISDEPNTPQTASTLQPARYAAQPASQPPRAAPRQAAAFDPQANNANPYQTPAYPQTGGYAAQGGQSGQDAYDFQDDDSARFAAVEQMPLAEPKPVPTYEPYTPKRKRKHPVRNGLLIALSVLAVALAVTYFTGVLTPLLANLFPARVSDGSVPSVFGQAPTAAVTGESGIAPASQVTAPQLRSASVDPQSATAPATLTFTLETNTATTAIRLLTQTNATIHTVAYGTPKGDGLVWQVTADMQEPYTGKVRVFLRDEAGQWSVGEQTCDIAVQ